MRALVVDDSKAIRMILSRMLKGLGMEVSAAENGKEALKFLLDNGPVDLALVDWNMPEMNGLNFVKHVRLEEAWNVMKISVVTIETEMSQVEVALEAGANEYIMKPFTPDVVMEKLELLGFELEQPE